ncbi:ATP-dependent DNA helicase, partial [Fusarium oxysporum f. sp. albedinis]
GNEPVAKRRRKYQNAFEEYCEQSRYEPSSRLSTPTTTPARMRSSATPESPRDEYEAWQQSWVPTDTDIRDPIAYWQDSRAQYPRLSRMALDFLTIQPMSAECERLFSAAGRLKEIPNENSDLSYLHNIHKVRIFIKYESHMIAPSHQLNVNPFNEGVQLINSTRGRRLLSQFTQYRSSVELVELFGSLVELACHYHIR